MFFPTKLAEPATPITSVFFSLPNAVSTTTVTGLAPSAKYSVSVNGASVSLSKDDSGAIITDSAGVARF